MFLHETTCTDDGQHPEHSSADEPSAETYGNCDQDSRQLAAACQTGQTPSLQWDDQLHELQSVRWVQLHQSLPAPSPAIQQTRLLLTNARDLSTHSLFITQQQISIFSTPLMKHVPQVTYINRSACDDYHTQTLLLTSILINYHFYY